MSEAINNISTKQQIADIINGQNEDAKFNINKTMESGGITSISYVDNDGNTQVIKDSDDNLLDGIFNGTPEEVAKKLEELCLGQGREALKNYSKESMNILNGLINYIKDNVKLNDSGSNATASSLNLNSMLGKISLFDIRELMKLLIQAFAQFFATQRNLDLNTITQIQDAMQNKIDAMELEKDEAYKAAMAQATGSIIQGAFTICSGIFNIVGSVRSLDKAKSAITAEASNEKFKSQILSAEANSTQKLWEGIAGISNGLGGLANGIAGIDSAVHTKHSKDAQITQTQQDAVLEILKKMQSESSEQTKQLMEFITRLLSLIQELQQSAAQTEKTIVQA